MSPAVKPVFKAHAQVVPSVFGAADSLRLPLHADGSTRAVAVPTCERRQEPRPRWLVAKSNEKDSRRGGRIGGGGPPRGGGGPGGLAPATPANLPEACA